MHRRQNPQKCRDDTAEVAQIFPRRCKLCNTNDLALQFYDAVTTACLEARIRSKMKEMKEAKNLRTKGTKVNFDND